MTPKDKAKELVKRYTDFNSSTLQMMSGKYSTGIAKQCALIAVDEILNRKNFLISIPLKDIEYWNQVKKEIEKI